MPKLCFRRPARMHAPDAAWYRGFHWYPNGSLSWILLLLLVVTGTAGAQWRPKNPVSSVENNEDKSVLFHMEQGALRIWPVTDSIIRVTYSATERFPKSPEYLLLDRTWPKVDFKIEQDNENVTISTAALRIVVRRDDGDLSYLDAGGKLLDDANRWLAPVQVNGENTYRAETFINMYGSPEGLYGLGQHQAGVWNYRGESVDVSQENTNIAIPMLLSSKGYGIFWNNTSRTRFNNRFANYLYISSEVADTIDYFFLYGPEFDRIIGEYRKLTGPAPLFGQWAYGFWQCKNRYSSQQELLEVAHKYRELHIPLDNIVQDWFWWTRKGEMVFNKNYPDPKGMIDELHHENVHLMLSIWPFFEPGSDAYDEMDRQGWFIDKFKFAKLPYHQDKMALYDATSAEARKYYWSLIRPLFDMGVDAWWMDTIEPETEGQEENILLGHKLAIGSGDRYANIYPLMATGAVFSGQRQTTDRKRVFILARSAFAGEQRNAVTAWSGDVLSNWAAFKRQVPAGLNFSVSGLPYWTTDIGGFIMGDPTDPDYRELFVRWFQFGAFSPIFRVHGTRTTNQNELWSYGPEAQKILVSYDKLRYRLMPYIYSVAWKVTNEDYTPMRPLVMDFRGDPETWNIGDQFMFGPALLVNPVTERGATTRRLYLPEKTRWYDFWTGEAVEGGRKLDAPAPLATLPLYVRAGSIIPMGPEIEYTGQKPPDPLEIRVYPGADGDFTLYEDAGDSYDYEKGAYATIPFHWDDISHVLTIGARKGGFPGMRKSRRFQIVFVRPGHGSGTEPVRTADRNVEYSGDPAQVTLK